MTAPPTQSKYKALERAALSGDLEQLKEFTPKYICCMPPFRQKQLCAMAAGTGNVECLKYMRESGAEWDEMAPMQAAGNGKIECMEYAKEKGCPFDIRMCIYAAEAGELEALHFAHEATGQPLNTAVAYAAAAKDNLPCLAYMVERGYKVEPVIAGVSCSRGAMSCLLFLVGIGVRLRANDIDYTQTVLPESGQEDTSIRSKALCLIFALNQGVRLTRRHWNTAVGASAQRMLAERRKAFYLSIGHAKALAAAAGAEDATATLSSLSIDPSSPPKSIAGMRSIGPRAAAAAASAVAEGGGAKPAPGAAAAQAAAEEGARACAPVHLPLARMPKDVAEIIAGYAHMRGIDAA